MAGAELMSVLVSQSRRMKATTYLVYVECRRDADSGDGVRFSIVIGPMSTPLQYHFIVMCLCRSFIMYVCSLTSRTKLRF